MPQNLKVDPNFWSGCGQKWDSKTDYLETEKIKWTDILHTGTNSGKLIVTLMIFGWMWSKIGVAF